MEKVPRLTHGQAMEQFKRLVQQYGLQWSTRVPAAAYHQLAACNEVLTTIDRRSALGLRN